MGYPEAEYIIDEVINRLKKNPIGGIEPNNLQNIRVTTSDFTVKICFTVVDTIIEDQTISTVEGVILRRKIGSMPEDEYDGDLVKDFRGEELHAYETTPYLDTNLQNGTEYCYRFFPYTGSYAKNRNMANSFRATPTDDTPIYGFHQDFVNSPYITYIGYNSDYRYMMVNKDISTFDSDNYLGSWDDWDWLADCKPCVIKNDGTVEFELDDVDYRKKKDGSSSGIDNYNGPGSSYTGPGAFVWIPKIYMKEVYAEDGNSRDVYFSRINTSTKTADFKPVGFLDKDNNELEGLWLPMFYMNTSNHKTFAGGTIEKGKKLAESLAVFENISDRVVFLGGPILNVLRDISYMLFGTTSVQHRGGYGASYRSSEVKYCNRAEGSDTPFMRKGFYGAGQSSTISATFGKAFHSTVLASYIIKIFDPYLMYDVTDDEKKIYASKNYNYSSQHENYINTGKTIAGNTSSAVKYPKKMMYLGDWLGSIPDASDNTGSSSQGITDGTYCYMPSSRTYDIAINSRFGPQNKEAVDGPGYTRFWYNEGFTGTSDANAEPMILPPVGYSPLNEE